MNLFELMAPQSRDHGREGRIFGVVIGLVTNNKDPDGMGRVKVKFPWLTDDDESHWARLAAPMAGKDRGICFLPEVDDEVLIAFDHGDVRTPYIIGALWNGKDSPPEKNGDGKNNIRVIKSRSGHLIRLTDEDGKEKIEIIDKSGKNQLVFDTAANTISITADKDIALKAPQGKISLEGKEVTITSSGPAKVEASGAMTLKGATIDLN